MTRILSVHLVVSGDSLVADGADAIFFGKTETTLGHLVTTAEMCRMRAELKGSFEQNLSVSFRSSLLTQTVATSLYGCMRRIFLAVSANIYLPRANLHRLTVKGDLHMKKMFGLSGDMKFVSAALENVSAAVMIADKDLNIVYMNKAVTEFLSDSEQDIQRDLPNFRVNKLVGENIDVFHQNPQHQRSMLAALARPHETMIEVGGKKFDLVAVPLFDGSGNRLGTSVEWKDATVRLQKLEYQGQTEAISRSQAVIEFTLDGEIVTANENFLGALGYQLNEIVGQHHRMFVDPKYAQSAEYQEFWKRLKGGEFASGEYRRIKKDGSDIYIQATYNPIFDDKGKPFKVIKFATDVTSRVRAVQELGASLQRLAQGDVSQRIDIEFGGDLEVLRVDFNDSMKTLQKTLSSVGDTTHEIDHGSREISIAVEDLSRRTESQAASVEQTASALEQISTTVKDSTSRAEDAENLVRETRQNAENSGEVVQRAVTAMTQIEESSNEISSIIGVIDSIAFQTNLLALNASVEAARAGEAGKGFAVVAQEVRQLAQRSAESAKEISELINKSGEQVELGVKLVGETGDALTTIVSQIQQIAQNIESIVQAAREQSTGIEEINKAVITIDQGTQQHAAMVEETTAASQALAEQARQLASLLQQFNLSGGGNPQLVHDTSGSPANELVAEVANAMSA